MSIFMNVTLDPVKDFKDKVAVITGAASGIGRAMAFRFAKEGMKLVLADIEQPTLDNTARELAATGASVLAVQTNVAKLADVETLASRAMNKFERVDVLCNNAGVGSAPRPCWEQTQADWEWVIGANLWSVIHGIRTFVPLMIRQNSEGHIVNTACMAGLLGLGNYGPYYATKHAVVSISESLHFELAFRESKLKASVLCPAFVNTKIGDSERNRPDRQMVNLPPMEKQFMEAFRSRLESGIPAEEVADKVVDAIREEKFYILTHPERKTDFAWRAGNILEERNPDPRVLLEGLLKLQ
jgi:NAD(P)-dependent dehydrogenase (short-subunit alcohol dehydrogenase family)